MYDGYVRETPITSSFHFFSVQTEEPLFCFNLIISLSLFFSFICFSSIFQLIRWNFLFIHQFQQCLTKHPWRPVRYFSYYKSFFWGIFSPFPKQFRINIGDKEHNHVARRDLVSRSDFHRNSLLFNYPF